MTVPARKRGPAPRISRRAVLDVARQLPADGLTMAAIGTELGVTAPALYRYFPDRAAVVRALAQELYDRLEPPDPDLPWREWIRQSAQRERALWAENPGLQNIPSRRVLGRPYLRLLRTGVAVLTEAGFSLKDAYFGLAGVSHLACSFGAMERHWDPDSELIGELGFEPPDVSIDEGFEELLAVLIDGLECRLPV